MGLACESRRRVPVSVLYYNSAESPAQPARRPDRVLFDFESSCPERKERRFGLRVGSLFISTNNPASPRSKSLSLVITRYTDIANRISDTPPADANSKDFPLPLRSRNSKTHNADQSAFRTKRIPIHKIY